MSDANQEEVVRNVSTEETDLAFSGPAHASNRFFVHVNPTGVRIAFTEQAPNSLKSYFRCAVTLSPTDAIQLNKLLSQMLLPLDQALEQVKEKAKE